MNTNSENTNVEKRRVQPERNRMSNYNTADAKRLKQDEILLQ